jgi:hypothetical protein
VVEAVEHFKAGLLETVALAAAAMERLQVQRLTTEP